MRGRTWIATAVTVAAVAGLLVWTLGRRDRGDARAEQAAPSRADAAALAAAPPPRPSRAATTGRRGDPLPAPWATLPPAEPPIVDAITIEQPEACDGEELLVTITAHTASGQDDAFLHGSIGNRPGLTVPIVVARGPDGHMAPQQATLHGRGGAAPIVLAVPEVRIKDCFTEYRALIATRPRANTVDEYDFSAEVAAGAYAAPFEPLEYRWRFGDGATETTAATVVTHSFGERAQDRLHSDLVVGVEVVDRVGKIARGRITVSLRNPAFEALARDRQVLVQATPVPRFAERDAAGVLRQRVRLWHHRAGPVALDRITVDGVDQDPGAVLGLDSVPPEGAWAELDLGAADPAASTSHAYQLFGTGADGLPAVGAFTVLLAPVADPPLEIDMGPIPPPADEDVPDPTPRSGTHTGPLDRKPEPD